MWEASSLTQPCGGTPAMSANDPSGHQPNQTVVISYMQPCGRFRLYPRTKKEGTEHVLINSGRRSLREEACRLARGETPSARGCTYRGFKDGQAVFPQEWCCGGRQGRNADRQCVGTRFGVRRTGRPPRSAPYGRREDPGGI